MEMINSSNHGLTPSIIMKHTYALYSSFAMLAGMELDIFTVIGENNITASKLAEKLLVAEEKLTPLLFALVKSELLTYSDGFFRNTEEGECFLIKGKPGYLGGAANLYSKLWKAAIQTSQSIKTGFPQANMNFSGLSEKEHFEKFGRLFPATLSCGINLAEYFKFNRFNRLLDIGAGNGGIAIGACKTCSGLSATIIELEEAAKVAQHFVEQEDMNDRVRIESLDIVNRKPPGVYDVAIARSFFQVLSREEAKKAIENIGAVMEPGACFLIAGRILDNTRLFPEKTALFNITFLSIYEHGEAYTEEEYFSWLENAGFHDFKVMHDFFADGQSVLTAYKK